MANDIVVQAVAKAIAKELDEYAQNYLNVLNAVSEEELWSTAGGVPNSIGTLARHLTGNLNHYFGKALLNSGYVRTRDREFSDRNIPKAQVIADLTEAVQVFHQALDTVDEQMLSQPYKSPDGNDYESLALYIVHMAMHFALHYGHADSAQHSIKAAQHS